MEEEKRLLSKVPLLTVAVTYRCNSRCRHCQIPLPESSGKADVELFGLLVEKLLHRGLKTVCLWGGEPMLEPKATYEILEFCLARELKTEVITNGFWGAPATQADRISKSLASSGLCSLHVSMDPFHQEWISIESVRGALFSAVEAGIPHVYWLGKYFDGAGALSLHDIKMDEMAQEMDIPGVERSPFTRWVQPVGRAARDAEILEQVLFRESTMEKCPVMPPISRLGIDPDNNLSCCDGTVLTSVEKFLSDRFEVADNHVVSLLINEGPRGLARIAGVSADNPGLRNSCHLCYEARCSLRNRYSEYLRPGCFYC